MHFELWDLEVKNILFDFDTLDEAVRAARELTAVNPDRYPEKIGLFRADSEGTSAWIARGEALLNLTDQSPASDRRAG
jgi:hypothetical protein